MTYFITSHVTLVKSGFDKCKLYRKYFDIVYAINISLFGYPGHMFFSFLFTYCWILETNDSDYLELIIKKIILIIIEIINICFTAVIITEIILTHKMKCKYGLINEYYLLAVILYTSIVFFIYTYKFLKEIKPNIKISKEKKIILNKFRDIVINGFKLPDNFKELKEVDKRKYILNNINKYEITISDKHKDLITLINAFRKENDIDELQYDKIIKFEDIIIDRFSEIFFKDNVNIFKLSKYNYLLKYPLEEFKTRFSKRQRNIINIILDDHLNKIIIIEKNNNIFISLFNAQMVNILRASNESDSERINIYERNYNCTYFYEDINLNL